MASVWNRQTLRHGRWNLDIVESQPLYNPVPSINPISGVFVGRRGELGDLGLALENPHLERGVVRAT